MLMLLLYIFLTYLPGFHIMEQILDLVVHYYVVEDHNLRVYVQLLSLQRRQIQVRMGSQKSRRVKAAKIVFFVLGCLVEHGRSEILGCVCSVQYVLPAKLEIVNSTCKSEIWVIIV
jgi:hypothetical protein